MYIRWVGANWTEYLISATCTLSSGIVPSVFRVTLAPPPFGEYDVDGDLVIGDDYDNEITFSDCRLAEGILSGDDKAVSATFTVRDRRWKWALIEDGIFGEYNRRDDNDNIVGTEKTARELGTLLLDAMGETGYSVDGLPASDCPYVDWRWHNPALMLQQLCDRSGARVCLQTNNKVAICAPGTGESRPDLEHASYSTSEVIIDKPATVSVISGPPRYQESITLEAVGYDTTDEVYKLMSDGSLDWKPTAYAPRFQDSLATEAYKEAARKTAFRSYRLPATWTIDGDSYDRADLMRYWADEIVSKIRVDGEERRRAPYVTGAHATESAFTDATAVITDTEAVVDVGFSMDRKTGIITFSSPVFDLASNVMTGADLTLTCAFEIPDEISVFYKTYDDGISGLEKLLRRNDILYEYIDDVLQNQTAARAKAEGFIDEFVKRYEPPIDDPGVETYGGVRDISPDGSIDSVTWNMSGGERGRGPYTTASWGIPHDTTSMTVEQQRLSVSSATTARKQHEENTSDAPHDFSRFPPVFPGI